MKRENFQNQQNSTPEYTQSFVENRTTHDWNVFRTQGLLKKEKNSWDLNPLRSTPPYSIPGFTSVEIHRKLFGLLFFDWWFSSFFPKSLPYTWSWNSYFRFGMLFAFVFPSRLFPPCEEVFAGIYRNLQADDGVFLRWSIHKFRDATSFFVDACFSQRHEDE